MRDFAGVSVKEPSGGARPAGLREPDAKDVTYVTVVTYVTDVTDEGTGRTSRASLQFNGIFNRESGTGNQEWRKKMRALRMASLPRFISIFSRISDSHCEDEVD